MVEIAKMLTTEKQLQKETGLTHEGLWEAGFDLDDWDICFVTKSPMKAKWLLQQMNCYCCGYQELEYNGQYYYMVYHS